MTKTIVTLILLCGAVCLTCRAAQAQPAPNSGFFGTWCAQGDRTKRASIASNGAFGLTLTNELGSTSTGHVFGINGNQIIADQWQLVRGTLSGDGRTISWTNGTFWARCSSHHHDRGKLRGTWYFGGDRSKPCHIDERGGALTLTNESGQSATGTFTGKRTISTNWSGVTITGTVSDDGNRILWSNGTYWTR